MGQSPDEMRQVDRHSGEKPTGNESQEELRASIEHTRSEMSETIDAIQAKLNPSTLKAQATDALREATVGRVRRTMNSATDAAEDAVYTAGDSVREAGFTMIDTIRHNPIPSLLAGIGISWLFANRAPAPRSRPIRYESQGYTSFYRDAQPGHQHESESGLTDKIGETASRMQAKGSETAGEAMEMVQEAGSSVGDVIRENPIPSALVGLGLGWLLMNSGSSRSRRSGYPYHQSDYSYGIRGQSRDRSLGENVQERTGEVREKAEQMASQTGESVQEAVGQMQATAGDVAAEVQQRVGEAARQTRYQASRVEDRFGEMLRTNPLMVGAAAVAVGALVGSLLPETERENELMGPTRDKIVTQARSTAEETVEKVQRVAGDVEDTAQREARKQGLTG